MVRFFKNKKYRNIFIAIVIALSVMLSFAVTVWAVETSGNTLVLVSKDYIDNYLMPKIEEQASALSSLDSKYQLLQQSYMTLLDSYNQLIESGGIGGSVTATASGYTRIKLEAGKTIYPTGENQVCIEIILEKGSAAVVTTVESETVLDATQGAGLKNGTEIIEGHYLVVPCANIGTGISAVNADAWILVRGEYTIE